MADGVDILRRFEFGRRRGERRRAGCKADDELDSIESPEEDNAAGGDEFFVKNFPKSKRMSITEAFRLE